MKIQDVQMSDGKVIKLPIEFEKVIETEKDFERWFRKNASNYGFSKLLQENLGKFKSPFPDFWCVKQNDRTVWRVELELFSYNFYLHKHNPQEVDFVFCVEDNRAFYGVTQDDKLPVTSFSHFVAIPPNWESIRCLFRLYLSFQKGDESMLYTLKWCQPPEIETCVLCKQPLPKSGTPTKEIIEKHRNCLDKAYQWASKCFSDWLPKPIGEKQ